MAVRVYVNDWASKARLRCPNPPIDHTDWQPQGEHAFYCQSCGRSYDHLVDGKTGDQVTRDEVDLRWR